MIGRAIRGLRHAIRRTIRRSAKAVAEPLPTFPVSLVGVADAELREVARRLHERLEHREQGVPGAADAELRGLLSVLIGELRLLREALMLRAEELSLALDPRAADERFLGRHLSRVHSQNYEDGMLAEILSRIGEGSRRFVEIGCGDGAENVTRFLLELGWSGVWIEGDEAKARAARERCLVECAEGRLSVREAMVAPDNVDALVAGPPGGPDREFDVLSIDIDRHTSHVWRALSLRPRIAVIEYNASFPPSLPFEVAYREGEAWDGSNRYGASLKTLELIGRDKGMALVGCDLRGVNAFFVREELLGDRFLPPFTAERHFQPARFNFIASRGHAGGGGSGAHSPAPNFPSLPGRPRVARLAVEEVPAVPFLVHGPEDRYVSECLLRTGRLEPVLTGALCRLLPLARGFADIGANLGYFSVIAHLLRRGDGMAIVAVEPAADNLALLRANLRLAGAEQRVVVWPAAIAERDGAVSLHLSDTNFGDHRIAPAAGEARRVEEVPALALATLLARHPEIDLIKIDAQGAEARILLPARETLAALRERLILACELWPEVLGRQDVDALLALFAELGLDLLLLDETAGTIRATRPAELRAMLLPEGCGTEQVPEASFVNIIATRRRDALEALPSGRGGGEDISALLSDEASGGR